MAANISGLEAWRYCTDCVPPRNGPFSAEKAYVKHLSSQGHLKKTGRSLLDIHCPECGKRLSRESDIPRHLASGTCPGRKSTVNDITKSCKKHALSVSPNVIVRKVLKTATYDLVDDIDTPHTSAAETKSNHETAPAVRVSKRHAIGCKEVYKDQIDLERHRQYGHQNQMLKENSDGRFSIMGPATLVPNSGITHHCEVCDKRYKKPGGLKYHNQHSPLCNPHLSHAPTLILSPKFAEQPPPDTQTTAPKLLSCEKHRTEHSSSTDIESHNASDEDRLTCSDLKEAERTTIVPTIHREEADQWLTNAMKSASLKDNNLAHAQVKSLISSTPASSMSSLGSLFLLRSPKVRTPKFTPPTSRFSPAFVRGFGRSIEMPTPMLTATIDEEAGMTGPALRGRTVDSDELATVVPMDIPKSAGQSPHLPREASLPSSICSENAGLPQSAVDFTTTLDQTDDGISSGSVLLSNARGVHNLLMDTSQVDINFQCEPLNDTALMAAARCRDCQEMYGELLVRRARSGDARGVYDLLMSTSQVDINFQSEGMDDTALMAAARRCDYQVMYALLEASARRQEIRLDLAKRNFWGLTIMEFLCRERHEWPGSKHFQEFAKTLVALFCCECPEETYPGSVCDLAARRMHADIHYDSVAGCPWGSRMEQWDWPQLVDLQSINDCLAQARTPDEYIKRAHRTLNWGQLEEED